MAAHIIQWNLRGLQANREDLTLLLSSVKPTVVALQETNIGNNHNINFRNYSFYNCPGTENNGIYHGGSALVVDKATYSHNSQNQPAGHCRPSYCF